VNEGFGLELPREMVKAIRNELAARQIAVVVADSEPRAGGHLEWGIDAAMLDAAWVGFKATALDPVVVSIVTNVISAYLFEWLRGSGAKTRKVRMKFPEGTWIELEVDDSMSTKEMGEFIAVAARERKAPQRNKRRSKGAK